MNITVSLNSELVNMARSYSGVENRSTARQIEHWAKIGRISEENPDLNYSAIKEMLLGLEDMQSGNVKEYDPDEL